MLFGSAASFIGITFNSFTFDSKTGAKTSIQPNIDTVTFLGPLTFIQDLSQLLSSLGGPSIDVSSAGIDASYTLALPDITVGIFSLTNLSLSAGVNIPFDGSPVRVRFSLCTQDNPFLLTIYVFGGGGFFALAIGADGIEEIQVSLEFGAAISINLGVASGGVSIMAGIYFSLQTVPQKQVQLTGFLRADGNLSVLGIIQISMEFYLGVHLPRPGPVLRDGDCFGKYFRAVLLGVGERHDDEDLRRRLGPRLRRRHLPERLGHLLRSFCVMTAQRVIWTACPNGTAPNGNLRISVAIGPQLMPTGTGATLADFPDWEDWPATQITWKATIGTDVVDATVVSAAPSSSLYTALFLPTTPVDGLPVPEPDGQRPLHLPGLDRAPVLRRPLHRAR